MLDPLPLDPQPLRALLLASPQLLAAQVLALGLGPLRPLPVGLQLLLALPPQRRRVLAALPLGPLALALGALALQLLPPFPLEPLSPLGLLPLALSFLRGLAPLSLELLRPCAALSLRLLLAAALALGAAVVVVLRAGIERGGADLDGEVVVACASAQITRLEARVEGRWVLGALGLRRFAPAGVAVVLRERLGDAAPPVGRG